MTSHDNWLEEAGDHLRQAHSLVDKQLHAVEYGTVASVMTGIARVAGLPGTGLEEQLDFSNGSSGIAFDLGSADLGVVLLGDNRQLACGTAVRRSGRVMDIPVGRQLLGRVINPLGQPLDQQGALECSERLPIERPAAAIIDRAPVSEPLLTGIKIIDALIPIGRGQRELIMGDRQIGKTAIAVDTIINQKGKNVLCVYCAIGQRSAAVARVIADLRRHAALDYTVIMVCSGEDPPGLAYIAPYAATSIAEHFMEQGQDVLIVYDDLTHHARAYRELCLLLQRPPGREAFPGDIFYLHARLLERATHLKQARGGGSLTALPIIETEAQNLSAYIPTNLISITDGQLYLSPLLFELGNKPAIDIGRSVSRVGGKAQLPAFRAVAGQLKLAYAQFEELESFSRFGTRLDSSTRQRIANGQRIRACLQQPQFAPLSVAQQLLTLLAVNEGLFDPIPLAEMPRATQELLQATADLPAAVVQQLNSHAEFTPATHAVLQQLAKKTLVGGRNPDE